MSRPIAPIVAIRLASAFIKHGADPVTAATKARQAIEFIESAGLDVVVPGWVPVSGEGFVPRARSWDDLPTVPMEVLERKPWFPQ